MVMIVTTIAKTFPMALGLLCPLWISSG
jgi:hypothetical protein